MAAGQYAERTWCMPREPAPADPGRDEDLPGTPPGPEQAPPPGGPVAPDWEPVITRPDPMTEEEREAWLDALAGQDEPFDPEEYPDPGRRPPRPGRARRGRWPRSPRTRAAAARGSPGRRGGSRGSPAAGRRRSAPGWSWTRCRAARTWPCWPTMPPARTTPTTAPPMTS